MDTYGTWANIEIVDTKEMEVEVDRSLPALSRKSAAFTLVADRFIFAIGGKSQKGVPVDTVACLDLRADEPFWKDQPRLNIARVFNSAIYMQSSLFTICGHTKNGQTNTIERLDFVSSDDNTLPIWQILQLDNNALLAPRILPAVALLNDHEFVILGGCDQIHYRGDIFTFAPEGNTLTRIGKNKTIFKNLFGEKLFKFEVVRNQCVVVDTDTVAIIACRFNSSWLVKWKKGDAAITNLRKLE